MYSPCLQLLSAPNSACMSTSKRLPDVAAKDQWESQPHPFGSNALHSSKSSVVPCLPCQIHVHASAHTVALSVQQHDAMAALQGVMVEPVIAADGHTYERAAIATWLQHNNISFVTHAPLPHRRLVPNLLIRNAIANQRSQLTQHRAVTP